jgi:hypothetical protein
MSKMPLREMGVRGREWMIREFSWNRRAREILTLYLALLPKEDAGRRSVEKVRS